MTSLDEFIAEAANKKARFIFDLRDDESRYRHQLDKCVATQADLLAELREIIQFLSERVPEQNWLETFGLEEVDGQYVLGPIRPERLL